MILITALTDPHSDHALVQLRSQHPLQDVYRPPLPSPYYKGLFLSDFVFEGSAAQFNMTSTVCPELQVDSEPCGALALAAVAVCLIPCFMLHDLNLFQTECEITFWVTGISTAGDAKRKEAAKILLSTTTGGRAHYIGGQIEARKWAKIKDAARKRIMASKSSVILHQATSLIDARGSLFEDSETG